MRDTASTRRRLVRHPSRATARPVAAPMAQIAASSHVGVATMVSAPAAMAAIPMVAAAASTHRIRTGGGGGAGVRRPATAASVDALAAFASEAQNPHRWPETSCTNVHPDEPPMDEQTPRR